MTVFLKRKRWHAVLFVLAATVAIALFGAKLVGLLGERAASK
jgi:hypothetical protein